MVSMAYALKRNTYYLGGFKRLNYHARRYLCIAAVAHVPLDAFSLELLQDDRFLRRAQSLKAKLKLDAAAVQQLPRYLFRRLALSMGVAKECHGSLRSDAMNSMLTGLAYLERESFDLLTRPPFSLTQGNLQENVARLKDIEDDDLATTKLKMMQLCAVPDSELVRTLELWKDAPCTVQLCEKSHGAGSLLAKAHGQYSPALLAVRCLISSARPMFTLSPMSAKEEALRWKLEKLEKRKAFQSPRNEFCSRLVSARTQGMQSDIQTLAIARESVGRHNALFDSLPLPMQAAYARQALATKDRKAHDLNLERQKVRQDLHALQQKSHSESMLEQGVKNTVASCKLSDAQLLSMCAIYNEVGKAKQRHEITSALLSSTLLESPGVPGEELRQKIDDIAPKLSGPWRPLVSPGGALQRIICANREHFQGTAFAFEFHDGVGFPLHLYVTLLCVQKPSPSTVFLKCTATDNITTGGLREYAYTDFDFVIGTATFESEEELSVLRLLH